MSWRTWRARMHAEELAGVAGFARCSGRRFRTRKSADKVPRAMRRRFRRKALKRKSFLMKAMAIAGRREVLRRSGFVFVAKVRGLCEKEKALTKRSMAFCVSQSPV